MGVIIGMTRKGTKTHIHGARVRCRHLKRRIITRETAGDVAALRHLHADDLCRECCTEENVKAARVEINNAARFNIRADNILYHMAGLLESPEQKAKMNALAANVAATIAAGPQPLRTFEEIRAGYATTRQPALIPAA